MLSCWLDATQVLVVPLPHALLLTSGVWSDYALPLHSPAGAKHTRSWAPLRQHVIDAGVTLPAPVEVTPLPPDRTTSTTLSPEFLQQMGDLVRALLAPQTCNQDALWTDADEQLQLFDQLRTELQLHETKLSRKGFAVSSLVQSVLLSSTLKNTQELQNIFSHALRIVMPVGSQDYWHALLQKPRAVPSASTIQRHQLTAVVAFSRLKAIEFNAMMVPLVCWTTVDASPQGGQEWLNHGSTIMSFESLSDAWFSALAVIHRTSGYKDHFQKLQCWLKRHRHLPTAVGSNAAGVIRKLRALAHSLRLQCDSWEGVAALMSASFSCTVDMGTESHFAGWQGNLQHLMGPWILGAPDAPLQAQSLFEDQGYRCQPVSGHWATPTLRFM